MLCWATQCVRAIAGTFVWVDYALPLSFSFAGEFSLVSRARLMQRMFQNIFRFSSVFGAIEIGCESIDEAIIIIICVCGTSEGTPIHWIESEIVCLVSAVYNVWYNMVCAVCVPKGIHLQICTDYNVRIEKVSIIAKSWQTDGVRSCKVAEYLAYRASLDARSQTNKIFRVMIYRENNWNSCKFAYGTHYYTYTAHIYHIHAHCSPRARCCEAH